MEADNSQSFLEIACEQVGFTDTQEINAKMLVKLSDENCRNESKNISFVQA